MTETKFTPGPWGVFCEPESTAVWVYSEQDSSICAMDSWTEDGDRHARDKANAHLIAEAPNLYSIAARWAALDGGAWDVARHARERDELLNDTREALAKARGEQL